MKRPSRRTIVISAASAGTAVVLVVGALLAFTLTADADARASFDSAAASHTDAITAFNTSQRILNATRTDAATTAQNAIDLAAIADITLLDDATTVDEVQSSLDVLLTAAELVEAESIVALPEDAPATTEPIRKIPTDRGLLLSQAAELRADAKKVSAQTAALATETEAVDNAKTTLDAAAASLIAAAFRFGSAATPPARASAESVAALTAAVTALDSPAADADLSALLLAYQTAWYATVASDAATRATSGAAEATYIKGILIVNKTYALPSTFGNGLTTETTNAFTAMQTDAAALGLNIYISSGFRSFSAQASVYNKYKANEGQAGADTHSARPGHSEHQSGLAFDLNSITQAFGSTPEGIWTADNAHLYGFIVRYPQGKEGVTGYIWEPWHLRYVGLEVATTLYNSGQTLEEYLGVDSVYP